MTTRTRRAGLVAAALALTMAALAAQARPAFDDAWSARPAQPSTVAVDIIPVWTQLAHAFGVDPASLPATVWVALGVAATACDVPPDELVPAVAQGASSCTARVLSRGLQQAVRVLMTAAPGAAAH